MEVGAVYCNVRLKIKNRNTKPRQLQVASHPPLHLGQSSDSHTSIVFLIESTHGSSCRKSEYVCRVTPLAMVRVGMVRGSHWIYARRLSNHIDATDWMHAAAEAAWLQSH